MTNQILKKILVIIPKLSGGGAEKVSLELSKYLCEKDYEVLLLFFENFNNIEVLNLSSKIKKICLNKKNKWNVFKIIFQIRKIIVNFKPNTIISFLFYTNILTILSSITVFKKSFKLIISERNNPNKYLSLSKFGFIKKLFIYLMYSQADIIISVSKQISKILNLNFKINQKKLYTIYNPLSLDDIKMKALKEVTHPFYLAANHQIIIGVGRLNIQKRFDLLLKAFSRVKKVKADTYLIILGEGPELENLLMLSKKLNISDSVGFVGFQLNPYSWMKKSDIFVLSSDFEGFPNVLIEAMALGIPVISTNCPTGPNEIITHEQNGILVTVGDEWVLSEKIIELLSNNILRRLISQNAILRANDFNRELIFSDYEKLLHA